LKRAAPALLVSIALALASACKRASDPAPAGSATTVIAAVDVPDAPRAVLDVVRDLDSCALGHRGVLLDFGDRTMHGRIRPGYVARGADGAPGSDRAAGNDQIVEHSGATWLKVRSRIVSASFYWPAVATDAAEVGTFVEGRVRGLGARAVAVAIDGKPVGTWTLEKGEPRTVSARATAPITLTPGGHELTLRFLGGLRGGDALAEIDWVHVGTGDPGTTYAAPTRADVLIDATVGDRSIRSISLRAPGFVRCSGWIPANATLEMSLAASGSGDADVEAQLLRDRRAPIVLGTAHLTGAGVAWMPWSVPIAGLDGDGALASVALVAKRAGSATRVLFGAPEIIAARRVVPTARPTARGVLLVVLGSTSARSLAPWGGPHAASELSRLAASGTTFMANRASSSSSTAVVASMLTGLSPQQLNIEDAEARLPQGPTTIAEACRQASMATAMFTANPTTGAAFGFDRGWDTFVSHDPLEDVAATRVFDDAATWIEAHSRDSFLVVVDARGGHPPWDASADELKTMLPAGYFGLLEPHRAAEALTKARKRPAHFKEDDRVRAWALYDRALDAHDEALGRLLTAIKTAGREEDTAVIVTGDVAASEALSVPFVDSDMLDEPLLATPLVVHWPGARTLSGRRVQAPTGPEDMARTVLGALGLSAPPLFQGVDLVRVAEGTLEPAERPLTATFGGRFAVRWGPFVLLGLHDRETRMCDLSLDPTCVADVRATSPLALEPLHRWAMDALEPTAPPPFPREGAVLDQHATAALVRWGRPADEREAEGQ
jgi:arylsulfatase A-like enzyme